MRYLTEIDLKEIRGGLTLTSTLLNAFNNLFKTLLNMGEMVGSAIRRVESGEICPLK